MAVVEFLELFEEIKEDPRGFVFFPWQGQAGVQRPQDVLWTFHLVSVAPVRCGATISTPGTGNICSLSRVREFSSGKNRPVRSGNASSAATAPWCASPRASPMPCAIPARRCSFCWPGGRGWGRNPPSRKPYFTLLLQGNEPGIGRQGVFLRKTQNEKRKTIFIPTARTP